MEEDPKLTIVVKDVEDHTLEKVIKYCELEHELEYGAHGYSPEEETARKQMLAERMKKAITADLHTLLELLHAAKRLDIQCLYSLTFKYVVKTVAGRTAEELQSEINFHVPRGLVIPGLGDKKLYEAVRRGID